MNRLTGLDGILAAKDTLQHSENLGHLDLPAIHQVVGVVVLFLDNKLVKPYPKCCRSSYSSLYSHKLEISI